MSKVGGILVAALLVAACGSGPSSPSSNEATLTLRREGISPVSIRVKAPGRVTFVNDDTRPHTMVSDPVDLHTDCPGINEVGFIPPGARRSTGTLNILRTCGFHDHSNRSDETLKGQIIVE